MSKACTNCHKRYDDVALNFYQHRGRFRSACKSCVRIKAVAYHRKHFQQPFDGFKARRLDCLSIRERLLLKSKIVAGWCVEWQGSKPRGYGSLRLLGKSYKAHRLSYEIEFGPIADGAVICHTCHNPSCINPSHLYLGSRAENARDMCEAGRHWMTRAKAEGRFLGLRKKN